MRRIGWSIALGLVALAGLTLVPTSAQAQSWRHDQFHNQLRYNQYQRNLYSDYAHQFPMTHWEHQRLHNYLDQQAYQDAQAHRQYHRYHDHGHHHGRYHSYPSYGGYHQQSPGFSLGFQNRNFSIRIGR